MGNHLEDYDLKALHKCLDTAFDDVELDSFCLFHYQKVFQKFSSDMRKDKKINLLIQYCYKLPTRLERLLLNIDQEDPEIFEYFKSKIRILDQSQTSISTKTISVDLIRDILEWKSLHNDSQSLLFEIDKILDLFTTYSKKPSLQLMSKAGVRWQENFLSRFIIFNENLNDIELIELDDLHEKMSEIQLILQKIMGEIDHEDFLYLHGWFLELKKIFWKILEISDHNIKETAQAL